MQEEDFVSNLYNRKLLTDFDTDSVALLLDQAIIFVENNESLNTAVREAIFSRLKFRKGFLHAVASEETVAKQKHMSLWSSCLALLSEMLMSKEYGTLVPSCFSSKIQRRLASTVPPRPLVSISIADAHSYLRKLFEDGIAAGHVLECNTGSQITVNSSFQVPIV